MLIGIVGFAGAGKGTVGKKIAKKYKFKTDSFANPVKDIASIMFGWDRALLEGDTQESRTWREQADRDWSKQLDIKNFKPRDALQQIGTEMVRDSFHSDFWILSLLKRWNNTGRKNTVITDCRFPNEITTIRQNGGYIIQVQKGNNPNWYNDILFANNGYSDEKDLEKIKLDRVVGIIPHRSETDWIGCNIDYKIKNDGTLKDLNKKVYEIMDNILVK